MTDTHASPVRSLLDIAGYHWISVCRQETKSSGGVKGSSGVACLASDSLRNRVSVVVEDKFARFMWIQISVGVSRLKEI